MKICIVLTNCDRFWVVFFLNKDHFMNHYFLLVTKCFKRRNWNYTEKNQYCFILKIFFVLGKTCIYAVKEEATLYKFYKIVDFISFFRA